MKLFKLMASASMIVLLTTGCSFSSESPEELLKDRPVYDESKNILYTEIEKRLPLRSNLILPANSSEVGKINEVDLNSDGNKELVVFEKKENSGEKSNEIGFVILDQNKDKTYTESDIRLENGDSIEYANFYDLNNDGNKEIILLIKNDKKTNMYIYNFENNEIQDPYILNPTWISNKSKYLDLIIKVGDADNDKELEIVMVHYDSKSTKAYVSIVEFKENLQLIDYVEFDNVKTLNNFYITIGNIGTEKVEKSTVEKKGVFLDIPIVQDDNYVTQILYLENNKLKKAFKENDKTTKPYYIPLEDINNDKVIDIPIINGSGDIYTKKMSATVNWYRWNGKEDEESGLVFTIQKYYNYQYNFILLIPNDLSQNSYIESEFVGNDIFFKFYYYDKANSKPKNLFTISVVNKNQRDEKTNSTISSGVVLDETNDYSFVLYQNDIEELKKFKINANTIKDYFSLMYK